ncbi:B12-binding domain-containing radical SAM protein [Thermodesulfobacteriota bacterium]
MTSSPVPRFDLIRLRDYLTMAIQTSRGCPFDCEFCDIVNLYGHKPRYKNPDQVIRELEALRKAGWRGPVFISDDNFIGNRSHARAILNKMIPWLEANGKPFGFWCQASVNLGQDLELIDLLTAANFGEVFLGVETPDEELLERNRKYQNVRNPLLTSLDNIKRNGLGIVASFIIGFDGEQEGAGERISRFVEAASIPVAMVNTLQALPNTRLWDRLKKENRLLEHIKDGAVTGSRLNYVPTRPESRILREYVEIWEYLYDPPRFLSRTLNYMMAVRPTRAASASGRGDTPDRTPPPARVPLRDTIRDLKAFSRLIWWQGVVPSYRGQFWKQLILMRRQNPSRWVKYVDTLCVGENMLRLRKTVRQRASGMPAD